MAETGLATPASGIHDLLRASALTHQASLGRQDVAAAMLAFAVACLEGEMTQTAADTLAYLLQDDRVSATVRDEAADIFAELESRICPRVILDARSFADGMDLATMLEYLLELIQPHST